MPHAALRHPHTHFGNSSKLFEMYYVTHQDVIRQFTLNKCLKVGVGVSCVVPDSYL